ncbi:helix-turn-helix transcriptional regulator [Myroides injenensis]|uniref:helix-turn-helix transcriptional regulator n=1 Tax=Myroides injenensis TaxID=1183151 RepID=UPI000288AF43|nr:AraC family transcriptional regulator [Myroides injenensis]
MEIGIYHIDQLHPLYKKENSDIFQELKVHTNELVTNIDHLGTKGYYKEIHFNGIHIGYGEMTSKQQNKLFYQNTFEHVEMHFTLSGTSYSLTNCNKKEQLFNFTKNQHNILYTKEIDSIYVHELDKFAFFEIKMKIDFFLQYLDEIIPASNEFQTKIIKGEFTQFVKQNHLISLDMFMIIQEMINCKRTGIYKKMFLESKVIELLLLQFEQFSKSTNLNLNKKDVENAYYIKEYLTKNLNEDISLIGLARLVGTNEYTLKKTFKELFNTTVFAYWHKLKMKEAKLMLQDLDMHVTEVADAIGYKNARHFATAFKKEFGISPSELY